MKSINTPLGNINFEAKVVGRADMQIKELPCTLQNGMTLDKVISCILVVEPSIEGANLVFSARLDNDTLIGSHESGESLESVSWNSSDWALSLGTEDDDTLLKRVKYLKNPDAYLIAYSQSGLELRLTGLEKGKTVSFHFIVAYKRLPDNRECSTWFAVDVQHEVLFSL